MPNLGMPEILVILIVALLVFGPRKLPELGKSLGAGLREFRRSTQGLKEEFEDGLRETSSVDSTSKPAAVQVAAAQPQLVTPASVTPQILQQATPEQATQPVQD